MAITKKSLLSSSPAPKSTASLLANTKMANDKVTASKAVVAKGVSLAKGVTLAKGIR